MADGVFGFLGDLLGLNAGDPAIAAANSNKKVLGKYNTTGQGYIDTGAAGAKDALNSSMDLTSLGSNANGIYGDALGLNGADGSARALDAFQGSNPGYQFQMDQGLQALDRSNAARGGFQSGGAGLDELKFSQGLADNSYQSWINNLNTGINRNVGTYGDLASLSQNTALQKTGLLGDVTSGFLDSNNQRAEGQSANKSGLSNLFGNVVGAVAGYGGF